MTPESDLKRQIKVYLNSIGAYHNMVPGGAYGKNGSPDIIVCYRGKFIAIEGKIAKGQQSGWQRLRQNQIERAGGIYIVARDVSDVSDIISSLEKED